MTVVTPPTIVPNSGRPPEDDLDGLLHAYFKAEMPDPWPSFEAPAPRNGFLPLRRPKAPRLTLWHSRLALAAAILLLITGALFVVGNPTSPRTAEPTTPAGLPVTAEKESLPGVNGRGNPGGSLDDLDGLDFQVDKNGTSVHQNVPIPRK